VLGNQRFLISHGSPRSSKSRTLMSTHT
jgi:hypothetical protein